VAAKSKNQFHDTQTVILNGKCSNAAVRLPLQRTYHKTLRKLLINGESGYVRACRKVKGITVISSCTWKMATLFITPVIHKWNVS